MCRLIFSFFLILSVFSLCSTVYADSINDSSLYSEIPTLASNTSGLRPQVLRLAIESYINAKNQGVKTTRPLLTIIDYSIPATRPRLWVLNLADAHVLFHTLVAHGKNSGTGTTAKYFSNRLGSDESSLGLYLTKNTYYGHRGLSLVLDGLEPGFNSNAEERHIVMHGAWYVSYKISKKYGTAGRSWGCPALPRNKAKPVINTIKNGTLIFAYYPEKKWLDDSGFLNA